MPAVARGHDLALRGCLEALASLDVEPRWGRVVCVLSASPGKVDVRNPQCGQVCGCAYMSLSYIRGPL